MSTRSTWTSLRQAALNKHIFHPLNSRNVCSSELTTCILDLLLVHACLLSVLYKYCTVNPFGGIVALHYVHQQHLSASWLSALSTSTHLVCECCCPPCILTQEKRHLSLHNICLFNFLVFSRNYKLGDFAYLHGEVWPFPSSCIRNFNNLMAITMTTARWHLGTLLLSVRV